MSYEEEDTCVLWNPGASQPLDIFAYVFSSTLAFSLRRMPLRLAVGATPAFIGSSAPPLPSLTAAKRVLRTSSLALFT